MMTQQHESPTTVLTASPDAFDYLTGNLQVASYLIAKGFRVKRVEERVQKPGRAPWKMIAFPADAEPVAETFFMGGTCEAKAVLQAFRDVRSLILDCPTR